MSNTFILTLLTIIVFTFITAYFKGRIKDKCLKEFLGYTITIEFVNGKIVWGILNVENTGLELVFTENIKNNTGLIQASYILYKNEFANIQTIIRFLDSMSETDKKKRKKELEKTYHPSIFRKSYRKFINMFKTIRDSLMDVINVLLGQIKKSQGVGSFLNSNDKYTDQIKNEFVGSWNTSYEPLFEKHIGNKMIFQVVKNDNKFEFSGVLKDYTSEFITILDVDYQIDLETPIRKADLILPRQSIIVRHLGE